MDTTGSLVVCKTDAAHQCLSAPAEKNIRFTECTRQSFMAISKEDSGTVNAPIGRHPTDRKKMKCPHKERKACDYPLSGTSAFWKIIRISRCRLETGRTHQIRVHMASIGHPLLGDAVYGAEKMSVPTIAGGRPFTPGLSGLFILLPASIWK